MSALLPSPVDHPARRKLSWFGGNMPVARLGLVLNLFVPLVILMWDGGHGKLGADPVNYALHTTGLCAVTFLILSLCVTPLRMATGWTWLVQFRRSLGVYAFYYACAHLFIYFWWDRGRSLHSTVYEIIHRYYLAIGFGSLVLMVPLWATSFNGAIRTMGPVWWKRLHRLAYVAAGLGCYHLYLQTKADKRRPDVYIAILVVLLLWRVVAAILHRLRKRTEAPASGTAATGKARFWKGDLKVIGLFQETPAVRTFRFAPEGGGSIPFAFQAGQFLNLSLDIDGKRISRSYTIASPPSRDGYIEVTIKREGNGKVSRFLHDMLMTGQGVAIAAPSGRFIFDSKSTESVLLIAGGVGITPVMSILRDLTDRGWLGKLDLVFSVRSSSDIIFDDELRNLAKRHPNVHVHVTITRDAPDNWDGPRGHLNSELLLQLVPDAAARPAFICGPNAMADAVRDVLLSVGSKPELIHVESFTPAVAVASDNGTLSTDSNNDLPATVTFVKSGRSAPIRAGQSVLEVAESAGVSIDFQCRSGICGTCRCKLISGQVTMAMRDALSDADEVDGYILACQARATEDVTVDA
jgi:ferredoxin-NADP reductase/DMSO/TMAO reductase YedYZ heme-binding membrane subunit